MEAFEQFVAVALEAEGFVVSSAVKFPVARPTRRTSREETQTHGYEVDLVGARADQLVLATVKSFLGSRGVVAEHVTAEDPSCRYNGHYRLLNEPPIRDGVIKEACKRYGYKPSQVQLRLYVGHFAAAKSGAHEQRIRSWCGDQSAGSGPIAVYGLGDVLAAVRAAAASKQYRNNPVLVTMKVLEAAGMLQHQSLTAFTDTRSAAHRPFKRARHRQGPPS